MRALLIPPHARNASNWPTGYAGGPPGGLSLFPSAGGSRGSSQPSPQSPAPIPSGSTSVSVAQRGIVSPDALPYHGSSGRGRAGVDGFVPAPAAQYPLQHPHASAASAGAGRGGPGGDR